MSDAPQARAHRGCHRATPRRMFEVTLVHAVRSKDNFKRLERGSCLKSMEYQTVPRLQSTVGW